MPEDASAPVTALACRVPRGQQRLPHREILVVARQDLPCAFLLARIAHEVFQQVQQTPRLQHPPDRRLEIHMRRAFHGPVDGFPLHEPVFARRDRSRSCLRQVAHNAECVVDVEARDLLHVILDLPVRLRGVRTFPHRRFQLDIHQRNPVDEEDDVRALLRMFHKRPLICRDEAVPFRVLRVDQPHQVRLLFAVAVIRHVDPVLQVIREDDVPFHHRSRFDPAQFPDRLVDRLLRHARIDGVQRAFQHPREKRIAVIPFDFRSVVIRIPELLQQVEDRVLVILFRVRLLGCLVCHRFTSFVGFVRFQNCNYE